MSKTGLALAAFALFALGGTMGNASLGPDQPMIPQAREFSGNLLAQHSTECRGGYRIIHQVESRGKTMPGVIIRC